PNCSCAVIDWRLQGSVSIAQQDSDAVVVARDKVELAITVEIGHRNKISAIARPVINRVLKSAIASAQKQRDTADIGESPVGHGHVRLAVTVEVADRNGPRSETSRIVDGRMEGTITLAQ